ncbi:hypothetical protein JZ751_019972, partial [Albula glossodonta]
QGGSVRVGLKAGAAAGHTVSLPPCSSENNHGIKGTRPVCERQHVLIQGDPGSWSQSGGRGGACPQVGGQDGGGGPRPKCSCLCRCVFDGRGGHGPRRAGRGVSNCRTTESKGGPGGGHGGIHRAWRSGGQGPGLWLHCGPQNIHVLIWE